MNEPAIPVVPPELVVRAQELNKLFCIPSVPSRKLVQLDIFCQPSSLATVSSALAARRFLREVPVDFSKYSPMERAVLRKGYCALANTSNPRPASARPPPAIYALTALSKTPSANAAAIVVPPSALSLATSASASIWKRCSRVAKTCTSSVLFKTALLPTSASTAWAPITMDAAAAAPKSEALASLKNGLFRSLSKPLPS